MGADDDSTTAVANTVAAPTDGCATCNLRQALGTRTIDPERLTSVTLRTP